MNKRAFAIAVVVVMILAVTPALIDSDADATQSNDTTVNVYFYTGSVWNSGSYEKFDLYEAVQAGAANGALGYGFTTIMVRRHGRPRIHPTGRTPI